MKALALTFGIGAVVALSGCSSMSGFDAKSEFACKAPDGILCESMSGIYANAQAKNLPGQRVNARGEAPVRERSGAFVADDRRRRGDVERIHAV